MAPKRKKLNKKARKRQLLIPAPLTKIQQSYIQLFAGSDQELHPELSIHQDRLQSVIKIEHIQEMILWVLGDIVNPLWFSICHKPLISRVVVVMIPDLRPSHVSSIPPAHPLHSATSLPIHIPSSSFCPDAVVNAFMNYNGRSLRRQDRDQSSSKRQKTDHGQSSSRPGDFVLSPEQLSEHNYPIVELDEKWRRLSPNGVAHSERMLAIDCEMCTTALGNELTRVSVVDETGLVLYDSLVLPYNPIISYNTEYSGITQEMLKDVDVRLEDAQQKVLELMGSDCPILVGHSLENDLIALKIVHDRVIDTSVIYPHHQTPYKHSLRHLSKQHLNLTIQQGCHDSRIDAQAAMALAVLKVAKGPHYGVPNSAHPSSRPLFQLLSKHRRKIGMIDERSRLTKQIRRFPPKLTSGFIQFAIGNVSAVHIGSDAIGQTAGAISGSSPYDMVFSRIPMGLSSPSPSDSAPDMFAHLQRLHDVCPRDSLLIVMSGGGVSARQKELQALRVEHIKSGRVWSDDDDRVLQEAIHDSSQGVALFTITTSPSDHPPNTP